MDEALRKKLTIGFLDIPVTTRLSLISDDIPFDKLSCMFSEVKSIQSSVNQVLDWLSEKPENSILWFGDSGFPDFTGIERHLPFMLFCSGKKPDGLKKCVSIVGTRRVSYRCSLSAFELGLEISANGICLVSGMAEGCDQCATLGALAGGGQCFEVLGCGLDVDYPSMTAYLKDKVKAEGGCLISRFAPKMPPLKQNFPNRNVIIAAMSALTVLVQAPSSSGALYTADFALQLGRDVCVAKTGVEERESCRGTYGLFQDGCPVIEHLSDYSKEYRIKCEPVDVGMYRFADRHYILKEDNN